MSPQRSTLRLFLSSNTQDFIEVALTVTMIALILIPEL